MAAEWICDACGKREKATVYRGAHNFSKPNKWFERSDEKGIQTACSRECIDKLAETTGCSKAILPF